MVGAKGAAYYDDLYQRTVTGKEELARSWNREIIEKVAPWIVGSVLDLGCGLGEIADEIDGGIYFGIDFSKIAIEEARKRVKNPRATFAFGDFRAYQHVADSIGDFDTVLVVEVLEHLDDFDPVVRIAKACAQKRIIATVPRDMPGKAHVKPQWYPADLRRLFGREMICELFGGEAQDRWLLGVLEVGE